MEAGDELGGDKPVATALTEVVVEDAAQVGRDRDGTVLPAAPALPTIDADDAAGAATLCDRAHIPLPKAAALAFMQRMNARGENARARSLYSYVCDIADAEIHLAIGDLYLADGQVLFAREAFQLAGKELPPDGLARACTLLLTRGDVPALCRILEARVALDTDTLLSIGHFLLARGYLNWAQLAFSRTDRVIGPEDYLACGDACLQRSESDTAVMAYRAALACTAAS